MLNPSFRVIFYSFVCVTFLLSACGDSTTIGSEIFDSEDLDVIFADDIELIVNTVRLDSIKTYNNTDEADDCVLTTLPIRRWDASIFPTHHLGTLNDPVFGKSKSSIYTQVGFEVRSGAFVLPNYNGSFDSMVLSLTYDTSAFYGDVDETFDVEVFRVMEDFDVLGDAAYSNSELELSPVPFAKKEGIRFSLDSVSVFLPAVDSSSLQRPALRIPFTFTRMFPGLGAEIFSTPEASVSNDAFTDYLKGLYITTTSEGNILPGIFIANSFLELYYTDTDGEKRVYFYRLFRDELISFNHIESDRAGSPAGIAAEGSSPDDMIYVSGQDGFDVTIDFSDVLKYDNTVLNKAELEFTLVEPVGSEGAHFPPNQNLILSQLGDNNELICIDDLSLGFPTVAIGALFGGELLDVEENGTVLRKYTMNITSHIQNYFDEGTNPILVLSVDNRTDNPSRTVLFGPDHPTNPARLKLTYTAP